MSKTSAFGPPSAQCEVAGWNDIRRSPVEVGSLSPYLQGFIHPRWLFGISSINSGLNLLTQTLVDFKDV